MVSVVTFVTQDLHTDLVVVGVGWADYIICMPAGFDASIFANAEALHVFNA